MQTAKSDTRLTVSFNTELANANLAPPALIFTGQIQEVKTSSNSSYTRFCSPCHCIPLFHHVNTIQHL